MHYSGENIRALELAHNVDMPREFYGGIETDKVGGLGAGYALFYKMTGDRKYS